MSVAVGWAAIWFDLAACISSTSHLLPLPFDKLDSGLQVCSLDGSGTIFRALSHTAPHQLWRSNI